MSDAEKIVEAELVIEATADLTPKTKEAALIQPTGYGGFTNKQLAILKATSFKDCVTMDQLAVACNLAKKYNLDPFAKEIWAMKMNGDNLVMEASASGWRKIIRRSKEFKRMVVNPWYATDEIEFDHLNGKILKHSEKEPPGNNKPVGAYCLVEYNNGTSNLARALWSEYGQEGEKTSNAGKKYKTVWSFAQEMIKNKASSIFGRTYCGVSGLYAEGEVQIQKEPEKENVIEDELPELTPDHNKWQTVYAKLHKEDLKPAYFEKFFIISEDNKKLLLIKNT